MPATPRDLATPEPWQASRERSIARRGQARGPVSRVHTATATATPARLRGETAAVGVRDLGEAQPWQLSLGRSRARRRASALQFVAAGRRARRISLGTLVALIAAPPASLADASGNLSAPPAKPAAPPTTTTHEVLLSTGSEGRQVRLLQKALGITVDGIYGPQTERAVIAYQASRNLTVDNIVGPETRAALTHDAPDLSWQQHIKSEIDGTAARRAPRPHARRDIPAGHTPVPAPAPAPLRALGLHRHATHTSQHSTPPRRSADARANLTQTAPARDRVKALTAVESGGVAAGAPVRSGTQTAAVHYSRHPLQTLQAALHVAVDGAFGPETAAALRRFQSTHGLAVNGVADPQTWAALGFHGMKELRPALTAPPRRAHVSRSETGGTAAGVVNGESDGTPAASTRPSPRRQPARHSAPAVRAAGYVNPLPGGFTAGRTDMGVDFTSSPGQPILAIGEAKILGIHPNWYPPGGPNGGNLLEYELLNGPEAGRKVYIAEQIEITVNVGQTVPAGAVVGRYASAGTGIEMGFAAGAGVTLAQASTGYQEGEETQAGRSFRGFLASLGAGV